MTIYMVYYDNKKDGIHDSTVIALFNKEEDAKEYVRFWKEGKQPEENFYYVDMELNKYKEFVEFTRNR